MDSSSKQSRNTKHRKGKKNFNNKHKNPKQKQIWQKKKETRNWLELPPELTAMILLKLGGIEILETAQNVCVSWYKICKDPLMWKCIDMHNLGDSFAMSYDLEVMARHAIDRSCGQLVDINIEYFGTSDLLKYLADRSPQLTKLRVAMCYDIDDVGLIEAVSKLPLLADVEITMCKNSDTARVIEAIGRSCPLLKSFKYNCQLEPDFPSDFDFDDYDDDDVVLGKEFPDDKALAIAANMPGIHHLMLVGNNLSNVGLQAILDSCPHLSSLDLRSCFKINLADDLGKRCTKQIKNLRLPHDSTSDFPFQINPYDNNFPRGSYDDYFGASDSDYYGCYESDDYDDFTRLNFKDDFERDEYNLMNEFFQGGHGMF